jgi:tetratricopeptide (TPR) repeat protein
MLELIHEYAGLKLDPYVRESLRSRFIQHYLQRLQAVNQIPEHKQQDAFYHLNVRNLHAGLKWAIADKDTEVGFLLAWHLDDLWMSHGYSGEGLELLKQLFALPDHSPPEVRINRLEAAADLAWQKHDFEKGLAFTRETGELTKEHGLQREFFWFLARQGRIYIEQGLYPEARQALEESLAVAEANPTIINPGSSYAQLGELSLFEGKLDEAKSKLEKSIVLSKTREMDGVFLAMAYVDLAEISLIKGDYATTYSHLCEAVEYSNSNIRRTLAFLVALTGYLVMKSNRGEHDIHDAARIVGAHESLSEQSGIILGPFYKTVLAERVALAKKPIPSGDWEEAHLAGRNLSGEDAFKLARRVLKIPD